MAVQPGEAAQHALQKGGVAQLRRGEEMGANAQTQERQSLEAEANYFLGAAHPTELLGRQAGFVWEEQPRSKIIF